MLGHYLLDFRSKLLNPILLEWASYKNLPAIFLLFGECGYTMFHFIILAKCQCSCLGTEKEKISEWLAQIKAFFSI